MSRYIDAEKLIAEIEKLSAKAKNDKEKAFAKKDATGHLTAVTKTLAFVKIKKLIATLQQQERTCKTCGFYENNCPFIRGKLIPYPNKVCKDYTYSVMKEPAQVADASKMERLNVAILRDWSMKFAPDIRDAIKATAYHFWDLAIYSRKEQPEVDLEEEVHNYLKIHHLRIKDGGRVVFDNDDSPNFMCDIRDIARHFYKLGLNSRKEE